MRSFQQTFVACLIGIFLAPSSHAFDDKPLHSFFENHCYECHDDVSEKGGLDLYSLSTDLTDPGTMQKWVRIFDRVADGEMPPEDEPQPNASERSAFSQLLGQPLTKAHAEIKGTVLRRLNRQEYENTLNDIFGTHLKLAETLPEDGRSHGFDTVGEALGLSRVQLQRYLEAADSVLEASIVNTVAKPESKSISASYADGRDAEKFLGKQWLKRPDGAVVFFQDLGYPSGQLREANTNAAGFYKVRVTGYAYQSEQPITFAVNGDTYARGADKPTFGYFSFEPGEPQTIEFETWIESRYMIQIKPWGIYDADYEIKNKGIENYRGPGLAILKVELEGPLVKEFPSRGHRLIFDGLDRREIEPGNPNDKTKSWYVPKFEISLAEGSDPTAAALPVLRRIAAKAFRRPVGDDELIAYVDLLQSELALDSNFEEALRTAISAILCSPEFIYLKELPGWLDSYALASRLSYFLTRSAPDDELLARAADGSLRSDPKVLPAQMNRLMGGPHFERFVVDFTDAWLNLREINFTSPDKTLFPEFDSYLQWSMLEESRGFFRELVTNNHPIDHIVKSDFALLNDRLAMHYELDSIDRLGPELRKVSLPADSVRGGVLSQAAIHKVSANGTNTSPVVRGIWVMERILGDTPAPPPPGIPGVEPDIRGASTLREILDKHRDSESCQSCHIAIDPPGFAMESFNPVGTWRERFRSLGDGDRVEKVVNGRKVRYKLGLDVDATGQTPEGQTFENFNQFRDILAAQPERLARAMTEKLLTFASGREMGFSDRPEIERIVAESAKSHYALRGLFHLVAASEIFRRK
jgi:hypothetical protein